MFNDLSDFYQSKEWRSLLAQLRIDRLDDNGQIICEYCGKPITRAYDMIGHHKEELTDDNVHDVEVSLNPANVAFVHHRCHNYIHDKLGYAVRNVYLVYGPPLAGKRTWVKENMAEGDLVVDMNNIWECISGQQRYVKPKRLNAVAFLLRDTLLDAVKYRRGKWQTAYVVGGYPLQSERERICRDIGAREVYIEADMEDCKKRIGDMGMPEKIDKAYEEYIDEWFERYTPPL